MVQVVDGDGAPRYWMSILDIDKDTFYPSSHKLTGWRETISIETSINFTSIKYIFLSMYLYLSKVSGVAISLPFLETNRKITNIFRSRKKQQQYSYDSKIRICK